MNKIYVLYKILELMCRSQGKNWRKVKILPGVCWKNHTTFSALKNVQVKKAKEILIFFYLILSFLLLHSMHVISDQGIALGQISSLSRWTLTWTHELQGVSKKVIAYYNLHNKDSNKTLLQISCTVRIFVLEKKNFHLNFVVFLTTFKLFPGDSSRCLTQKCTQRGLV